MGLSTPRFECKNNVAAEDERAITRFFYAKLYAVAARKCREELIEKGFVIDNFRSENFAGEIEKLRISLGFPRIAIIGASYGTHLALHYAQRYSDRVSALILIGVEGFDDALKLPMQLFELFHSIDESGGLGEKIKLAYDIIASRNGSIAAEGHLVTPFVFSKNLSDIAGNRNLLTKLGLHVDRIRSGDFSEIENYGRKLVVRRIRPARDIVDCASGVSKSRFTRILAQMQSYSIGQAIAEPLREGCESWGRSVIKDEIPRWRGAAIPTLIVSGTWDGRTPPRNAVALAKDLESSTVVVVRGLAHEVCRTDACRKLVADYVEGRQPSKGRIIHSDRTGDKLQHVDE